jgi:hypothetical protein
MQKPRQQKILNLIVKGIRNAQDIYTEGSKSLICWGHEYLITTNIFQSLLSLRTLADSLSLEEKVSDIEKYKRDRRGRKPACVCGRSRCDLVIWHTTKDAPRAIIEVKRWAEDCFTDIDDRLTYLTDKVKDLKFSVAASCLFEKVDNGGNADDRLRKKVKQVYQKVQDSHSLRKRNLGVRMEPPSPQIETITIRVDDKAESKEDWVWCPICFVIYRKKNRR